MVDFNVLLLTIHSLSLSLSFPLLSFFCALLTITTTTGLSNAFTGDRGPYHSPEKAHACGHLEAVSVSPRGC